MKKIILNEGEPTKILPTKLDFAQTRIALVVSRFNCEITAALYEGAVRRLHDLQFNLANLTVVQVPGAVEIPLAVKILLQGGVDGVAALGAVIRGQTSHYDLVCNAVERGCSQLQVEFEKPVVFGVITTENDEQAWDRTIGGQGNKGSDAIDVLFEMVGLVQALRSHNRK